MLTISQILYFNFLLQIPVVIAGVIHMMIVKADFFSSLSIPIHRNAFGENKTWRGVIVMIFLTAISALLLFPFDLHEAFEGDVPPLLLLGAVAGAGYILFELPNSFFKRRLGVKSGESLGGKVDKKTQPFLIVLDQIDSAFGIAILYFLILETKIHISVCYFFTLPITVVLIKRALFFFKLKESAF